MSPQLPKSGARTKGRRSLKEKDPNAPKRPLSDYMFYAQANRERVREENPGVSFGAVGKIVSQQWSELSEQAKAPYVKLAEDDKKRYETEMAHYVPDRDDK